MVSITVCPSVAIIEFDGDGDGGGCVGKGWYNIKPHPSNDTNLMPVGEGGSVKPLAEVTVRSKLWDAKGAEPAHI